MKRFFHLVLAAFGGVLILSAAGMLLSGCATNGAQGESENAGRAESGPESPEVVSMDLASPQPEGIPSTLPEPTFDLSRLFREVVSYMVSPAEKQQDGYGYISVSYQTAEEVVREKAEDLKIDPEDRQAVQKLKTATPAGGVITIGINRKELLHANTKWYSYTLQFAGDKTVTRRKGAESIPFVKGRDNLWWNTDEMPVAKPLEGSLTLCVEDAKIGSRYCFTIEKTVTREELAY